jgi:hypothetical protein
MRRLGRTASSPRGHTSSSGTSPPGARRRGRCLLEVRQPIGEASEALLERVAAESVALLAAPGWHHEDVSRLIHDEAAHTVDLRLADEAIRVRDRLP